MRNPGRMQHVSRVRTRPVHAAAINKACGGVREINKMLVTMLTLCNFGACSLQRPPPERWRNTFWIGKARLHTRTGLRKSPERRHGSRHTTPLGKISRGGSRNGRNADARDARAWPLFRKFTAAAQKCPRNAKNGTENISRMQRTPSRNTKPRRIGV